MTYNFVSCIGMFLILGVGVLLSSHKRKINLKTVASGVFLQLIIAWFLFTLPIGTKFFLFLNDLAVKILNSAKYGAEFVFGRLALSPGQVSKTGESSLGFILAFQAFPTIIFFSAFISVLYFFRIMPLIIRTFSFIFTKLMRISGAESLVAASNIFVGVESALTVKPYLERMTKSELCSILTVGMATVASNVLALYVFTLKDQFPTIAGHLISASLLSAPAGLVMSKIILPETETPQTLGKNVKVYYQRDKNLFEAIIKGANEGLKMIAGIVALLIAVLGMVALVNLFLSILSSKVNALFGTNFELSLEKILGFIFWPFTLILGIPLKEVGFVSKLIGERAILTEVVAYKDLAILLKKGLLSMRSAVIATYALCGFTHLASIAIFVGGISSLVPKRTKDLTEVSFKAFLAATLACLLTACIAGIFFTENSSILLRAD